MDDYRRDSDRYRSSNRRSSYGSRSGRNPQGDPRGQHPARSGGNAGGQRVRRVETLPSQSGRLHYGEPSAQRPPAQQQSRSRRQTPPSHGASRSPYFDDQMRRRAPNSNNYRARSSQMMSQRDMRQPRFAQPAAAPTQRSLLPRIIIVAVLLAVLIIRFIVQGGMFGEFGSANAQVAEQQTQLEQLTSSNNDMQSQMDSMQGTIDAWNEMRSK